MMITDQHKIDTYYQALIDRNAEYIGIFFVGVKTTSVFCIATCRARKPKKENVQFYSSFQEALKYGFRPCKICKPTENAQETPPWVEKAVRMVKEHPKEKITDEMLRQNNIGPEPLRRWFKSHYGITYHAFQRMYRINNAYKELKDGKKTTDTAFNAGYESLSGFGYTFKKVMGNSPTKSRKGVVLISRTTTPIGPMFLCATEKGLCLLEFTDRRMLETEFKDLQKRLNSEIIIGENEHIRSAKKQLREYFQGLRSQFTIALDTPGTAFQQMVWEVLKAIPFGETTSYKNLAQTMGRDSSVRAVANANGHNRLAIIIPCHRVIGSDGKLTGYGGGLERKRWLLDFEKVSHPNIQQDYNRFQNQDQ